MTFPTGMQGEKGEQGLSAPPPLVGAPGKPGIFY